MNATFPQIERGPHGLPTAVFVTRIGGCDCPVRCIPVSPIHELLGFEEETDVDTAGFAGDALVADVIDSRMIAPPRPRRRRDRSVSSRAAFYAPAG